MSGGRVRTDDEMLAVDVPERLRAGLGQPHGRDGAAMRGDAAIAAAIAADRFGAHPRSLVFLAEVVRRGGRRFAAGLADPLPTPELAGLARAWLAPAAELPTSPELDEALAHWLDTVAGIVAMRRRTRGLGD